MSSFVRPRLFNELVNLRTPALARQDLEVSSTADISGSYVNISTNQVIDGIKTFNSDIRIGGVPFGVGANGDITTVAIGEGALDTNIGGVNNVAVGAAALTNNTNGNNNVAIGNTALANNTTGVGNVAIGFESGYSASPSASNKLYIGNNSSTNLIEGDFAAPSLTINGSLQVIGNMTITGTNFIVNTVSVSAQDNLITLNAGEVGAGVTSGEAGIEIDRGTLDNYFFKFVESNDSFSIGTSGDLQKVATRQDAPTANGVAYWNNSTSRFDTSSDLTTTSGRINATGATWIGGNFGGTGGTDTVVIGNVGAAATIGGHTAGFGAWDELYINSVKGSADGQDVYISNAGFNTTVKSKLSVTNGNITLSGTTGSSSPVNSAGGTARHTLDFGGGGYGTPGNYQVDSDGDKVILYNGDGVDARIGFDGSGNLWIKNTGVGSIDFYAGSTTVTKSFRIGASADYIQIPNAKTPASSGATGTTGDICWDSNYVYVCVASNTWKRSALSTW